MNPRTLSELEASVVERLPGGVLRIQAQDELLLRRVTERLGS